MNKNKDKKDIKDYKDINFKIYLFNPFHLLHLC